MDARISPAGDRVAYVRSEIDWAENATPSRIWLVKTSGGAPLPLTAGPGRDDVPRWSPDGKTLAFLSDRDGSRQIWLIDPDGGEAVKPASVEGGVSSFAWSPDGRKIGFLARAPKPPEPAKAANAPADVIVYDPDVPGLQLFVLDLASKDISR